MEERELKLTPLDPGLLDELAGVNQLGPYAVIARRTEQQLNSFFDTGTGALRRARLGFRRRTIEGERLATWTLKAEGSLLRGISTRPEIELRLDADMPPAIVIGTLGQAARQRGAVPLAEQLRDALSAGPLPLAQPYLETEQTRVVLDLRAESQGWEAELALDRVRLVGHPRHVELEVEVELKRGEDEALDAARQAIEALGRVRESDGSKLSRAYAHLANCDCP